MTRIAAEGYKSRLRKSSTGVEGMRRRKEVIAQVCNHPTDDRAYEH